MYERWSFPELYISTSVGVMCVDKALQTLQLAGEYENSYE